MARLVSFVILAAIIIVFAVLFFQVMAQFLLPMFLAVILVVMFRPVHQWFILKCGGQVRIAAGITTFVILVIVLAPMISILTLATRDAIELGREGFAPDLVLTKLTKLRHNLNLDFLLQPPGVERLAAVEDRIDQLVVAAETTDAASLQQQNEQIAPLVPQLEADIIALRQSLFTPKPARQVAQGPAPNGNRPADPAAGKVSPQIVATGQAPPASTKAAAELTLSPKELTNLAEARQALDRMQAALDQLSRQIEVVAGPEDDPLPPNPAVVATVETFREAFDAFRTNAIGGPLLSVLRLWANPTRDEITAARDSFQAWVSSSALATGTFVGGFVANFVIGLAVLVISLYYFLADGPGMIAAVMRLLPLDDRYERQLLDEFDRISRAVVLATLLAAVVQGLLAGIGFLVLRFEVVPLLTVLTMVLALVPFVGAAAVWGSCAVWLLVYEERVGAAVALVIYGTCVISMADNVIKPIVLHGQSRLHPLLALLSVLGGVRALGPIGIFVGPMAVALLQALLNILNTELLAMSQRVPTLHAPE